MKSGKFILSDLSEIRGSPHGLGRVGICGVTIEKYGDVKIGDVIEAFIMEQIEVK